MINFKKILCRLGWHSFKYNDEIITEKWIRRYRRYGDYGPYEKGYDYERNHQLGLCEFCGKAHKNYID